MDDLTLENCRHREGSKDEIRAEDAGPWLDRVEGWSLASTGTGIEKTFRFDDFYRTMGFVNAVAWIANREDHHPDLEVSYSSVTVRFSTHSVGGLSENDFICAAKIDVLR